MKNNRENKLYFVVILAAVVAALTTLAMIFIRMRSKKKALAAYGDSIDYDLDDCCCDGCEDSCEYEEDIENYGNEASVKIPTEVPEEADNISEL